MIAEKALDLDEACQKVHAVLERVLVDLGVGEAKRTVLQHRSCERGTVTIVTVKTPRGEVAKEYEFTDIRVRLAQDADLYTDLYNELVGKFRSGQLHLCG